MAYQIHIITMFTMYCNRLEYDIIYIFHYYVNFITFIYYFISIFINSKYSNFRSLVIGRL